MTAGADHDPGSVFGFLSDPFPVTADASCIFSHAAFEHATEVVRRGLTESRGLIVVTGEIGTGKTTLLNRIAAEFPRALAVRHGWLKAEELPGLVARQIGLAPDSDIQRLEAVLRARAALPGTAGSAGGPALAILIDEAQHLGAAVLEEMRLFLNLEADGHKLVTIVLFGQPELSRLLAAPDQMALRSRVAGAAHLSPLSVDQAREYLAFRLKNAQGSSVTSGASGTSKLTLQFSDAAANLVHEYSRGLVRVVHTVADEAVQLAALDRVAVIEPALVEEAIAQFAALDHPGELVKAPARMRPAAAKAIPKEKTTQPEPAAVSTPVKTPEPSVVASPLVAPIASEDEDALEAATNVPDAESEASRDAIAGSATASAAGQFDSGETLSGADATLSGATAQRDAADSSDVDAPPSVTSLSVASPSVAPDDEVRPSAVVMPETRSASATAPEARPPRSRARKLVALAGIVAFAAAGVTISSLYWARQRGATIGAEDESTTGALEAASTRSSEFPAPPIAADVPAPNVAATNVAAVAESGTSRRERTLPLARLLTELGRPVPDDMAQMSVAEAATAAGLVVVNAELPPRIAGRIGMPAILMPGHPLLMNSSPALVTSMATGGWTATTREADAVPLDPSDTLVTLTYLLPVRPWMARTLGPRKRGDDVSSLQQLLKTAGYLSAAPNGWYGAGTVAAMKKLRDDLDFPPSADLDPLALLALESLARRSQATPATHPPTAPR